MSLIDDVQKELEQKELEQLEELAEWWLDYHYTANTWESEEEYNMRREMVVPFIIDCKLKINEEEYYGD